MMRHTTVILRVPVLCVPFTPEWVTLYGRHEQLLRVRYGKMIGPVRGDLTHGYVEQREKATIVWRAATSWS